MNRFTYLLLFTIPLFSCSKEGEQYPVVPDPEFGLTYGGSEADRAYASTQSLDGCYMLAGNSKSNDLNVSNNHGQSDAWVLKLNKKGEIIWQKSIGGSANDGVRSIAATQDGGFILAGYTESNDGDVTGNHGGSDAWVLKLDKDGNKLWQVALGGSGGDYAGSVKEVADGGYVMVGETGSTGGDVSYNHGLTDAWVVKLDRNGTKLWQKTFGGSALDGAQSIIQTPEGEYLLTGYTNSNDGDITGYHEGWGMYVGNLDGWVVRMDRNGNLLWSKAFGGVNTDNIHAITEGLNNSYTIAGVTRSNRSGDVGVNHGGVDAWVVNIDRDGRIIWQKTLGGLGNEDAYSVTTSRDGSYVLAGYATSNDGDVTGNHGGADAWVVKLDKDGSLRWQRALGGSNAEEGNCIFQHTNGYLVMCGYTNSTDGDVTGQHGAEDVWIVTMKEQ